MIPRFTRALLASILILAGVAHAADGTIYQCWDGRYWSGADSTACPPQVTITGGAGISDTTANITATTDSDSGTLYVCYKAAPGGICPTAPTYAQMLAGGGGFSCVNDSTPSIGNNEFPISGLTASTSYCAWALQIDDDGRPPPNLAAIASYVYESDVWATLAAAPSGDDLETYNARFVGTGGVNDANCGSSHADRCLTTAGLLTPLPAGTDLYLLAGTDNGQLQLNVNWSGSNTDRVIIGCYYMDEGVATSCNQGSGAGAQTKPLLRGTYEESCRATATPSNPSTCPLDSVSAVPASSTDQGIVQAIGQQYITIQDLRVQDSSGVGVLIDENNNVPSYAIIQRVDTTRTYWNGLRMFETSAGSSAIIRDNTVTFGALSFVDGRYNNWPSCVNVQGKQTSTSLKNTGVLVENNIVTYCAGEAFNAVRVNNVTFRGNLAANTRRVQYYADNSSYTIIEHNIAVGGGWSDNGYTVDDGHCFSVAVEDYPSASNSVGVVIRNNLCTSSDRGLTLLMDSASRTAGRQMGFVMYGNTFALNNASSFFLNSGGVPTANIDYIEIANNLFTGIAGCSWSNYGVDDDIRYNAWSTEPAAACFGANSVAGNMGISLETWNAINLPTVADLTPNAVALNAGSARTSAILDVSNYSTWASHQDTVCDPSETNWEAAMAVDYSCVVRGATPDIGAVEVP